MTTTTAKDDPRNSSLEIPFSLPPTWHIDTLDGLGTSGMFLSGLIMVTRNRMIAWPALLFGINQVINIHPRRTKEGSSKAWSNLFLCVSALVAAYVPMFVISSKSS